MIPNGTQPHHYTASNPEDHDWNLHCHDNLKYGNNLLTFKDTFIMYYTSIVQKVKETDKTRRKKERRKQRKQSKKVKKRL